MIHVYKYIELSVFRFQPVNSHYTALCCSHGDRRYLQERPVLVHQPVRNSGALRQVRLLDQPRQALLFGDFQLAFLAERRAATPGEGVGSAPVEDGRGAAHPLPVQRKKGGAGAENERGSGGLKVRTGWGWNGKVGKWRQKFCIKK